jgi:hypothetical protein
MALLANGAAAAGVEGKGSTVYFLYYCRTARPLMLSQERAVERTQGAAGNQLGLREGAIGEARLL